MKLAIYQTSDLHGYVYPTNYVKDMDLGILKIGSYILRDEKNYDASLKIDCGDLIQGSALAHYLSKGKIEKNPLIQGLEFIGYDAYVIGNHEFNYGKDYLINSYKEVENKIINANIEGLSLETKPYKIFNFNGFKVGCIGFTTSFIPNWEHEKNINGLTFLDPVEIYGKYEKELKEKADFIVVCYHGGFEKSLDGTNTPTEKLTKENQASELLEKYDSINMVLSGHQHRSFITKINGVVCSQPLHNGQNFTKIVLDTESKEVAYKLVDVSKLNDTINEDIEKIFNKVQVELQDYLNNEIGEFDKDILMDDIFTARLEGHPFISFLHQVQLDASGADFSALSLFDSAIGFKKNVSIRDVLINYPYPNTLMVLKITGNKLKEAMEKAATYFVVEDGHIKINNGFLVPKVQNYNYDMFYGVDYEIDLNRDFGERVISITKDGKTIDLDKEYTIVLNNYRATNTSIYPAYENAKIVKEINVDISELIINYFQENKNIKVIDESNYIIK
ncbi:Trifunctional nucleotide phosphoesterase protein YfkN precursor [uncultured Clostridium sp.]|uniref:bifunctional metallophosphatase/5'-nucleotidase n=1 Tax=uncultured Clostridium sp. TaxID=59620 RepID=UPI0008213187|nr:bifunctional UDP-sugar hydrolase/5'-nucleotidase [uncultured Clostridium sp.]SCJ05238.1 Trifunctional nucleotide phosphoesterase protein YfkN precursor [uncultured Clostridium sp.]